MVTFYPSGLEGKIAFQNSCILGCLLGVPLVPPSVQLVHVVSTQVFHLHILMASLSSQGAAVIAGFCSVLGAAKACPICQCEALQSTCAVARFLFVTLCSLLSSVAFDQSRLMLLPCMDEWNSFPLAAVLCTLSLVMRNK